MGQISVQWASFDDLIDTAEYINSLGTTPGLVTLVLTTPEAPFEPADVSPVVISDGNQSLNIPECRLTRIQEQKSTSGFKKTVVLQDARWKWSFGTISGTYNTFLPDGTVDIETERDLAALVALLMIAMGQLGQIDGLDDLDKTSRPFVQWDFSKAGEELDKLLEAFGWQLTFDLDQNVGLVKIGEAGDAKETQDAQELPVSRNVVLKPTNLLFAGKRNLNQGDYLLEALAIDEDGSLKPLADVSYASELTGNDIHYLLGITDLKDRERARKSLFRYYRIVDDLDWDKTRNPTNPMDEVPDHLFDEGITEWSLKFVLPLPGKMAAFGTDENGEAEKADSEIHGEFYDVENNRTIARDGDKEWPELPYSYTLDLATGVVKFDRPVFKLVNKVYVAPVLYLRTGIEGRRTETGLAVGGPGDTTQIVRSNTLGFSFVDGVVLGSGFETETAIQELLDGTAAAFDDNVDQGTVKLIGLHLINLDGVTRQVTYTASTSSGANTTYSINNEHERKVPTQVEKASWSKIRAASNPKLLLRGEDD